MAYVVQGQEAGVQRIADTSTTQNHPLGKIVQAVDATRGSGEFIYLLGVASTAVGSVVTYNADSYATTLLAANAVGSVAVAMSANVASQYGWYQISGKASAKVSDVNDSSQCYIDTAAGTIDDAVVAGDMIWNAVTASADDTATNLADLRIARPFVTNTT